MDRARAAGQSLETEQLRKLGAEEKLILREDGALVLDEDDAWGTVEIVDLEDEVPPDTIDLDLDDACVVGVQEVASAPATPVSRVGTPPPVPATTWPPPPTPAPPPRLEPPRQTVARIQPVRNKGDDVLRAIVAGDFAQAQQALGHQPKPRVASKPRPRRSSDK